MHVLSLPNDSEPLTPKQIGRSVAEDMTTVLPGDWKVTADGVRRADGRQRTDINLQRASASRGAHGVWLYPRLIVRDSGLKDWLSLNADWVDVPIDTGIFNSLLVNFTTINTVFVSQTRVDPKSASYDEFLTTLLEGVLPIRELMRMPGTLLDLPDPWLWDVQGMLLWSVSVGRADLCWGLVDRNLGTNEVRRDAFTRGLRQQERGETYDRSNNLDSLGHLLGRLRERVELGASPRWLNLE